MNITDFKCSLFTMTFVLNPYNSNLNYIIPNKKEIIENLKMYNDENGTFFELKIKEKNQFVEYQIKFYEKNTLINMFKSGKVFQFNKKRINQIVEHINNCWNITFDS